MVEIKIDPRKAALISTVVVPFLVTGCGEIGKAILFAGALDAAIDAQETAQAPQPTATPFSRKLAGIVSVVGQKQLVQSTINHRSGEWELPGPGFLVFERYGTIARGSVGTIDVDRMKIMLEERLALERKGWPDIQDNVVVHIECEEHPERGGIVVKTLLGREAFRTSEQSCPGWVRKGRDYQTDAIRLNPALPRPTLPSR